MKKAVSIVFCFILVSFTIINILMPKKDFSENENRSLAQFPQFTFDSFKTGKFFSDISTFTADQFALRDFWVGTKAQLEKITGKKENNGVYFAKDGYLIQKPDTDEKITTANINAVKLTSENSDCNVSLVLIPTAFEVYKEKLPEYAYSDKQSAIFGLADVILKDTKCSFLDLRDKMEKYKEEYIYYKTDHHQTTLASFYIYEEISKSLGFEPYDKEKFEIKTLSDEFYGTNWSKAMLKSIKPDTVEEFVFAGDVSYKVTYPNGKTTDRFCDYSQLEKKDKYAVFLGGNYPVINIDTSVNNGKGLILIKDSYANTIVPFLANHYEKIIMIDLRYYNQNITKLVEENNIEDICFMFNANSFGSDRTISKISLMLK